MSGETDALFENFPVWTHGFRIFDTREEMGMEAARADFAALSAWVEEGISPAVILAAAASQAERAAHLSKMFADNPDVRDACTFYHMDENIAPGGALMDAANPNSFAHWLVKNYVSPAGIKRRRINLICEMPGDEPEDRAAAYADILGEVFEGEKTAVAILGGIGVSGHFAYCDPGTPAADVNAEKLVDIVELDETTREQELNDFPYDEKTGAGFRTIDEVHTRAVTLTMRALTHGKVKYVSLTVPNREKAPALRDFWTCDPAEYGKVCVAAAVRGMERLKLEVFADRAAAALLTGKE